MNGVTTLHNQSEVISKGSVVREPAPKEPIPSPCEQTLQSPRSVPKSVINSEIPSSMCLINGMEAMSFRLRAVDDVPAVVLAAGGCDGLIPLSVKIPKALLHVGNKSLICGTLENLWSSGICRILIITDKKDNEDIELHVRSHFLEPRVLDAQLPSKPKLDVTFHPLVDRTESNLGTTDVLKHISANLDCDFLVVPCDLHGHFNFRGLIEHHRSSIRLCTLALIEDERVGKSVKRGKEAAEDQVAPGGNQVRGWGYKYRVLATLDTAESQIIGISDVMSINSGESYELSKWSLMRHPHCTMRRDLYDAHIYMFSKDIFKVASLESMEQTSIRLDLIPYIIRMQETVTSVNWFKAGDGKLLEADKLWAMDEFESSVDSDSTRVFYYLGIGDAHQCCRVNSLESLMATNMQACLDKTNKQPPPRTENSSAKVRDVIVASGCQFGSNANIRSCVFGTNVSIGAGCKISRCVIMDDVKIEDNVVLDRCIIGGRCTISAKTTMKHVVVAPDHTVPGNMYLERDFFPPFIEE
ncbi:putative translation initiation factor eIF-2B subunit gamma, related [Babesia divergens]|uniref:Translation initiation factor eIF2B subunit gamma n=1 Tax=Babesia divergens TaxID=32595 RepID=A0AAD9LIZ0_BABDI|nr:putative translation initiation factor eIF-2B subunit gamma, related [Babesia divergens]